MLSPWGFTMALSFTRFIESGRIPRTSFYQVFVFQLLIQPSLGL